ncbi:MAG TPA: type IA DNA topoisomerase [Longimicrobiales bacterium]|nr:type IA DNA topoisomerase [Longimicrobiales bacterium]
MSNILIVESGAKAQTLQRYLGDGWTVVATGGHVETLPYDRRLHGKDASKAYWANRAGALPAPPWVWTERGEAAVAGITAGVNGGSPVFWIATDPDREGEFIAWSLERRLDGLGDTRRVTFQEVTEDAVREAIERPRGVDRRMVDSALVRKFLDRLVGYRASKMASAIVSGGDASMGRVQTPTLGFVVDRELEREAHVPIPYFEVQVRASDVAFTVRFHEPDAPDVWRDDDGRPNPARTADGDVASAAHVALDRASVITLTRAVTSTRQRQPAPPFSTDALLQAAGSRFGWSPKKTSALASMLYESGHITYIRTDSTRLAATAVAKAQEIIGATYGTDHLGEGARAKASAGPTQDAHEAIRPSRLELAEPPVDDADARRLYRLIRAQTLASRMAPSQRTVVRVEAQCDGLVRPLTGSVSWRTFAGWEAAFAEFLDTPATAPPDVALEAGAVWPIDPAEGEKPNPVLIEDATKPPPRYRPHTLIRAMKDAGIGRPSTYSRTVEKLEERSYIVIEDGSVVPTERGRTLWTDVAPLYDAGDADDAGDDGSGGAAAAASGGTAGGAAAAASSGTAGDPAGADTADTADEDGAVPMDLFSPGFTAAMEAELDRIASGGAAAPATWELWRDRIRELHASAQDSKNSGGIVPNQLRTLRRLLANAPPEATAELSIPEDLTSLSFAEARELIRRLREVGVQAAPTERQVEYLRSLIDELALPAEELEELVGFSDTAEVARLTTSTQVSAAIDTLKQVHDERRPPSVKQRRFIDGLLKETGVPAEEALAAVGVESLDDLTGGPAGTASALIDWLQARVATKAE